MSPAAAAATRAVLQEVREEAKQAGHTLADGSGMLMCPAFDCGSTFVVETNEEQKTLKAEGRGLKPVSQYTAKDWSTVLGKYHAHLHGKRHSERER